MAGVYGDMMASFPELYRTTKVWTKEDKSDVRDVAVIYLATAGDSLTRWLFGRKNSAVDYKDHDMVFVDDSGLEKVHPGDYIYDADEQFVHRIMGETDYQHPGGFKVFTTERVTGATVEQRESLTVKEPQFA